MRNLHPVKASDWVKISQSNKELLSQCGAVPINDVYWEIWQDRAMIKLLRGGRGGGKSEIAVDTLLNHCLHDEYFKCYYGRKVFENVRSSCFETLVTGIKKNNLDSYFHYSTAGTSSMVITCKNGNVFKPFGADRPDKLKSLKDPTHFWFEEFDQFTFDDFKELYPTLRTVRGRNEMWGTFNAYSVYDTHWLLKVFYPEQYRGEDKATIDILDGIIYSDYASNYTDNYFIDQIDYERKLRLSSGGSEAIYQGLACGAWGVMENINPWLYSYDENKHIKQHIDFMPTYPVYVSFDFNNDPFACTIWQYSPQMGHNNSFIHCIKEFSGVMKVEEMCQRIKSTYPSSILYVTGDRSGQNEDIGRNQTLYQMIGSFLGLSNKQLNLNTHNLEHADSRLFVNAMLHQYPNVYFSREGCPNLCRQLQAATIDKESKSPSKLLKNREDHKNDEFDSMRYFFQTYFHDFAKNTYFKVLNKR